MEKGEEKFLERINYILSQWGNDEKLRAIIAHAYWQGWYDACAEYNVKIDELNKQINQKLMDIYA
jgi:hypothetical protein